MLITRSIISYRAKLYGAKVVQKAKNQGAGENSHTILPEKALFYRCLYEAMI